MNDDLDFNDLDPEDIDAQQLRLYKWFDQKRMEGTRALARWRLEQRLQQRRLRGEVPIEPEREEP